MSHPTTLKYDVFLSFRGEDTRDNFTSHLYAELRRKNIETFIDYRLERGDEINSSLVQAIDESLIYVVILSEHYASSSWCLDELTEILKCKERYTREVIPVFYKVDPSNVRNQRQSYADDLAKHHQRFGGKVDLWKAALNQVAGLSGWDSQVTSPESTLVEKIAEDILKKLNRPASSNYYEGMTGMDKHIKQIQSLIQLESPTIRIIGIWGMGGIGKTTIAKAIFEKLATQFNFKSIVLNVQQEIKRAGLSDVKSKYLSKLLDEDIKSSAYNFSFDPRLRRMKVLLVFDDVKHSNQLEDLIGTRSNFGQGSRIIVTSRDKQVLLNANADKIYKVREMDDQDSLQLFHSFAFKHNHPIEQTYVSLSKKVLDYANGVPLALQVLGSLLYGKSKEEWESELQKLEKLPEDDIFDVLKLSYDGLDHNQKDIFLDIACFYRGEFVKVVEQTLDWCGFFTRIGMKVLEDRCLISISNGKVWMHDLIQEMGHQIVRLQDKDPEKRSRLWKSDDIYDVLKKNKGKGTDAIQCIFLYVMERKKVQLHAKTFKEMCNLRIIKLIDWDIPTSPNVTFHAFLESLPNSLKILHWEGFPQRSLPQDFPENLVTLNMRCSYLEQLWKEEDQALPNLKRLNLSYSRKLTRLPDLSLCPNIEEVILSGCESLIEVYSSSFLDSLNWLCLDGCISLQSLDIRSNILSRSSGLVALHGCHNLQTLLISSRTDVVQSDSFPPFNINTVRVFNSAGMVLMGNGEAGYEIKEGNQNFEDQCSFTSYSFTSINEFCWLDVSNCTSLTCLPTELLNLKFLRRLCLNGCLKLEELPEIEETMVGLEELSLNKCKRLKTIPSSIGNLGKLLKLDLTYCESLETFPSSIFKLKLTELNCKGCSMLRTFPEILEPAESFAHINLTKTAIEDLPSSLEYLVGLQRLNLKLCSNLVSLPNNIVKLSLLSHLDCSGCCRLTEIPSNIGCLSSLTELSLKGSSIVNLPESMAHLSSLKSLDLSDCEFLECVPKLPPNLTKVQAFDCPSIKTIVLNSKSDSEEGTFQFHLTNSKEPDETSWKNIGEEARIKITDDAYGSVVFCFPGSTVPCWFHYCSKGQLVTVNKDSLNLCSKNRLIGFALCAVMHGTRWSRFRYNFRFISDGEIYSYDDCMPGDILNRKSPYLSLKQDHTFLWKHQLDLETIGNKLFHAQNFTLEFQPYFNVKEFGMCPLYTKRIDDGDDDDDNRLTKRKKFDDNSIEEQSGSKAAE